MAIMKVFYLSGDKHLYLVIAIASIMTFIAGATVGWSSPIVAKLQKFNETSDYPFEKRATEDEITWIASVSSLSTIIGTILFTKSSDLFGRKKVILFSSIPFMAGYGILIFAREVYLYILARFLLGMGTGIFNTVRSHYINEICHQSHRGVLASTAIIAVDFGTITVYTIGPFISIMTFNLLFFILSVVFLPMFYFAAPESPYYLLAKNNEQRALLSLQKLRNSSKDSLVKELEDMKMNVAKKEQSSILELFKEPIARKATSILAGLIVLQQFTGISVIMSYAQSFFERADSSVPSEICPIIVGVLELLSGLITPFTCDKFGRKILLIVSAVGSATSLLVLGIYFYLNDSGVLVDNLRWLPLACFVVGVIFYGFGIGILPFVVVSELLPMNVKFVGSTIVMIIYFAEHFLLVKYYLVLCDTVGMANLIWSFCAANIAFALYTHFFMIETKGKTLNEIQQKMRKRQMGTT